MKNKRWIGLFIILGAAILIFPQENDRKDKLEMLKALQALKSSIKQINDDYVIPLEKLDSKSGIIKALEGIKVKVDESNLANDLRNSILSIIETFIGEANQLDLRDKQPAIKKKAEKFSKKLIEEFLLLISSIDIKIEQFKKEIAKAEKPKEKVTSALDITGLLTIAIVFFLLNLLAGIILYFIFYKKKAKETDRQYGKVNTVLLDINKGILEMKRRLNSLDEAAENGNNQLRDIILLMKQYGEEFLEKFPAAGSGEPPPQSFHGEKGGRGAQAIDDTSPTAQDIAAKPDIIRHSPLIDFPTEVPGGGRWVKLIISTFQKNKEKLFNLVENGTNGHIIKKWVENIGGEIKNSIENQHDEKAFFKRIYPDIKTNRSKLSDFELSEFGTAFLLPLFKALEIEEFGQPGERFNPTLHQVIGEQRGSVDNVVKGIIEPGYKMKYTGDIIIKALVKF